MLTAPGKFAWKMKPGSYCSRAICPGCANAFSDWPGTRLIAGVRQRLGHRGQQFVQQHFAVHRMVDDLHQLYLRLGASEA